MSPFFFHTTLFFHTTFDFTVLQFRIRDKSPTYSASQHVCWKTNCEVHKTSWSSISSENTFLQESTVIRQSSKPYILQNSTAIDNYLGARNRVETEWYSGLKGKFLVIKGPDSLALNICIKKTLVLLQKLDKTYVPSILLLHFVMRREALTARFVWWKEHLRR